MRKATASLIVALVFSSFPLSGQSVDLNERIKALSAPGKPDTEYRLGAGDLIEISVFGVDNYRQAVRISAAGVVKLPLIDPVKAEGLTPAELEHELAARLGNDIIKDPQVSVFVREYRSQPVYVLGAVKTPGQYQITLQLKIVDVIAMAGGLQTNAVDEAVIQRTSPDGEQQVIKVNLTELLEQGNLDLNVPVHGGDVIHIQERLALSAYVVGEVNQAGAFALPAKQDLLVSQLVAWAGGPTKTARLSGGILMRYDENGVRVQLPMNFADILKGKKEDFVIRANDIVFIPGSRIKIFEQGLMNATVTTIPFRLIP
jgi:polysaccharide export outer membrane protein